MPPRACTTCPTTGSCPGSRPRASRSIARCLPTWPCAIRWRSGSSRRSRRRASNVSGSPLEKDLEGIASAAAAIATADASRLAELKVELLGRKAGRVTEVMRALPKLDPADRRDIGSRVNALKQEIEAAIEAREGRLAQDAARRVPLDPT